MSEFPTTDNVREGMSAEEHMRFTRILAALSGMPADLAVALLMTTVCEVIDQGHCPELWEAIASGARAEIKLARSRPR